jgi:hypothetical protein
MRVKSAGLYPSVGGCGIRLLRGRPVSMTGKKSMAKS